MLAQVVVLCALSPFFFSRPLLEGKLAQGYASNVLTKP